MIVNRLVRLSTSWCDCHREKWCTLPDMGRKRAFLPPRDQKIETFKGAVGQTMIHALDSRYFVISILPVRPLANQI